MPRTAMFTDWCTSTGTRELPADPGTIAEFLRHCPAALATLRRRVASIDHQHITAARPEESAAVRAAIGRPVILAHPVPPGMTDQVVAALRGLPSHGWTRGMFGRRERCLLVLSQLAGVPYQHIGTLTVGDIALIEGTATIRSTADAWELARPTTLCCAGRVRSPDGSAPSIWRSPLSVPGCWPKASGKPHRSPTGHRISADPPDPCRRPPSTCRC